MLTSCATNLQPIRGYRDVMRHETSAFIIHLKKISERSETIFAKKYKTNSLLHSYSYKIKM